MNNRFLKSILFVGLFAFSLTINAQHDKHGDWKNKTPENHAAKKTEKLAQALSLSDKQKSEVLAIMTKYAKERQEKREQMKPQHEAIRQKHDDEIKAIFTPTQYAEFQKIKAERKEKRTEGLKGERRGDKAQYKRGERPSPTDRVEKMTQRLSDKLNLDAKQQAALLQINTKYAKIQQEQKQKMKPVKDAVFNRIAADMKSVLTPEQYNKFLEMKEKRSQRHRSHRGGKS